MNMVRVFILCLCFCLNQTMVFALTKEDAIKTAQQTPVAYVLKHMDEGKMKDCLNVEAVRPCDTDWVTCIEEAWVVRFTMKESCGYKANEQSGVTIVVADADREIVSIYPEIDYIEDPKFCLSRSDCHCTENPEDPELKCVNFMHTPLSDQVYSSCSDCECLDYHCSVLKD